MRATKVPRIALDEIVFEAASVVSTVQCRLDRVNSEIATKRLTSRNKLVRQGERGRMILDAGRRGPATGMPAREIISELLRIGGHSETARRSVAGRVRAIRRSRV